MNQSDIDKLIEGISASIDAKVLEAVYEQTKHKDEEISGLHRQINNKLDVVVTDLGAVKKTVDEHDKVINEIMEIYRTSSRITKAVLWLIVFVPGFAACIAAYLYLKNLIVTI